MKLFILSIIIKIFSSFILSIWIPILFFDILLSRSLLIFDVIIGTPDNNDSAILNDIFGGLIQLMCKHEYYTVKYIEMLVVV